MHPAVALRYPFLNLQQAAYFLGVSFSDAKRLYHRGELPKALCLDGGIYEPLANVTLIPYLEFVEQVSADVRRELERWQRGVFELSVSGVPRTRTLRDGTRDKNGRV